MVLDGQLLEGLQPYFAGSGLVSCKAGLRAVTAKREAASPVAA